MATRLVEFLSISVFVSVAGKLLGVVVNPILTKMGLPSLRWWHVLLAFESYFSYKSEYEECSESS